MIETVLVIRTCKKRATVKNQSYIFILNCVILSESPLTDWDFIDRGPNIFITKIMNFYCQLCVVRVSENEEKLESPYKRHSCIVQIFP